MASRLGPEDKILLSAIGEVLHYVWDPIGVAGSPRARDEYDGYVGPVFFLLRAGATESEVSEHLQRIATDRMGMDGCRELSDRAASVLLDWRDAASV
jgi:hypothetical protein